MESILWSGLVSSYCFLVTLKLLLCNHLLTLCILGGLLGESFTVKHILPLLRNVIFSCIDSSKKSKPEPQNSWNSSALIDSLSALEGLVSVLPVKAILKEFLQVLYWQDKFLTYECNKG
jgi:WD repeat-containing protein 81